MFCSKTLKMDPYTPERVESMPRKKENKEEISKEERIGFHKGALDTLIKERQELLRIVGIVEQLIAMHIEALRELGVNLDELQGRKQERKEKKKKPIEEALKGI